ncbi:hypothetical protein MRX96_003537 [Rhipicephalus microplus]
MNGGRMSQKSSTRRDVLEWEASSGAAFAGWWNVRNEFAWERKTENDREMPSWFTTPCLPQLPADYGPGSRLWARRKPKIRDPERAPSVTASSGAAFSVAQQVSRLSFRHPPSLPLPKTSPASGTDKTTAHPTKSSRIALKRASGAGVKWPRMDRRDKNGHTNRGSSPERLAARRQRR